MKIAFEGADGNRSTVVIDEGTGDIMVSVTYDFNDGDKSTVEVDTELGLDMVRMEEEARNSNRAEMRRHNSLSTFHPNDGVFTDATDTLDKVIERCTNQKLHQALKTLLPQQRNLVYKVFFEERTLESIAREEGVTGQAIHNRLTKIYTKLKKKM